jgi:hypothetical protein
MIAISEWLLANWELIGAIMVLLIVLGLSGNITKLVKQAKEGLKETITPLGFLIFLALCYLVLQIYLKVVETL